MGEAFLVRRGPIQFASLTDTDDSQQRRKKWQSDVSFDPLYIVKKRKKLRNVKGQGARRGGSPSGVSAWSSHHKQNRRGDRYNLQSARAKQWWRSIKCKKEDCFRLETCDEIATCKYLRNQLSIDSGAVSGLEPNLHKTFVLSCCVAQRYQLLAPTAGWAPLWVIESRAKPLKKTEGEAESGEGTWLIYFGHG